jgi:hypothetical protein
MGVMNIWLRAGVKTRLVVLTDRPRFLFLDSDTNALTGEVQWGKSVVAES